MIKLFFDKTRINSLNEREFYSQHNLNEMARISDKLDNLPNNTEVWVYSEKDLSGNKPPHFHVLIDHGKIELEIYIQRARSLIIWRTKNQYKNEWQGLSREYKALKKWLDKQNVIDPSKTNLEAIVTQWNYQNPNHQRIDMKYAD